MDYSNDSAPSTVLARFACEYCRQKKFKCSRELPKCSACKPWPGSCDYKRDKLEPKLGVTNVNDRPKPPIAIIPSSIEQRLQSIESSLQKLTEAVERVLEATSEKPFLGNNSTTPRTTHANDIRASKDERTPGLFLGPSHSFSFLKEASNNIETASRASTPFAYQHAHSELQFLSSSLTTATVKTEGVGDDEGFFIPSKALGYQLIGTFLEHAPTGELFFTTPSDDLLRQIVFHPEQVAQKAWVVYFNYIMLAQASTEEEHQANKADKFRRNVRCALNDSSIFLEPREINVQALTIMAMHGEDYTSPNLSWMIVGHACRQAEALGLHVPPHIDFEPHQRSLALFWMLFIVDKSCTLAFGRSPFLPVYSYQGVPLPDFQYLLKFQPHITDSLFGDSQKPSRPSHFGAHFFLAGIKLAKIMGSIIEFLSPGPSAFSRQEIKMQLETWHAATMKTLEDIMEAERPFLVTAQLQEMCLGLNSTRFQYLHIVIILLKGDESFANLRLEAAREALFLLPTVVSNWSSIYNGVIWNLLYYPFIPFFVVFENIIHNHASQSAVTIDRDLQLMATTVSYFASMRGQMRLLATLCIRLERVASVFLQLAKSYLGRRTVTSDEGRSNNPLALGESLSSMSSVPAQPATGQGLASTSKEKHRASGWNQDDDGPVLGDDVEIGNLINWLPADTFPAGLFMERGQQNEAVSANASGFVTASSASEGSRSRKRTFDATFDWFSWDAYYMDGDPRQARP
ncbi:hypothetical protein LZ31DRAFT_586737 [Colletotrichum somersetense]|nr:hypothetical protein LZ31DRAFT_586737 [Colletotrichum somersetense]